LSARWKQRAILFMVILFYLDQNIISVALKRFFDR